MAYANGTRRSKRLAAKPQAAIDSKTHARTRIQKSRTTRRKQAQEKKPSVDLEAIEAQLTERKKKPQRPCTRTYIVGLDRPIPRLVEEITPEESDDDIEDDSEKPSEDEFGMEDDSEQTEDEFNEQAHLSHDHIEYVDSHNLKNTSGHRYSVQSYDSRLESGNEDYERDDFFVNDDESVEMEGSEASDESDGDLDLTINMERNPVRVGYQPIGRAVRAVSILSSADSRRRSSTGISPKSICQASVTSDLRRRSSSKLFVCDLVGDPSIPLRFSPWMDLGFQTGDEEPKAPTIAQASAEVVEEIVDALALFSRRVNQNRPSISLRLAAAVLDDEEIRDALEGAVRTGLGRKLSLADGSKRWTIGPKGR